MYEKRLKKVSYRHLHHCYLHHHHTTQKRGRSRVIQEQRRTWRVREWQRQEVSFEGHVGVCQEDSGRKKYFRQGDDRRKKHERAGDKCSGNRKQLGQKARLRGWPEQGERGQAGREWKSFLSWHRSGSPEAQCLYVSTNSLLEPFSFFPDVRHRLTERTGVVTVPFLLKILSLTLLRALCIRKPQDTFVLEFSQEKVLIKMISNFYWEFTIWQALSASHVLAHLILRTTIWSRHCCLSCFISRGMNHKQVN